MTTAQDKLREELARLERRDNEELVENTKAIADHNNELEGQIIHQDREFGRLNEKIAELENRLRAYREEQA